MSTMPASPATRPTIWRPGGRRRTISAAMMAVKIGVAPFSMPVTLDETRCSASGNSDSGIATHTTPSTANRGHAARGTGSRVAGTEAMTSSPNMMHSHVTRNGCNDSKPTAIRKKLEPQISPGSDSATQSRSASGRSSGRAAVAATTGPWALSTRGVMPSRTLRARRARTRAGFGHLVPREHDDRVTGKRGRILRTDDEIDELLERTRSVAVVGVSSDSKRPSRRVTAYLIGATDWTVMLVNPNIGEALGRRVYPSLADLPEPPDLVDAFRRVEHLPAVVEDAIAAGAGAVWFQLGLVDDAAAAKATEAGLDVVQDHCLRVELYRWQHAKPKP